MAQEWKQEWKGTLDLHDQALSSVPSTKGHQVHSYRPGSFQSGGCLQKAWQSSTNSPSLSLVRTQSEQGPPILPTLAEVPTPSGDTDTSSTLPLTSASTPYSYMASLCSVTAGCCPKFST